MLIYLTWRNNWPNTSYVLIQSHFSNCLLSNDTPCILQICKLYVFVMKLMFLWLYQTIKICLRNALFSSKKWVKSAQGKSVLLCFRSLFVQPIFGTPSGVARAIPGGQLPQKMMKIWQKIRKIDGNLRKNESGALAHLPTWDCEAGYAPSPLSTHQFLCCVLGLVISSTSYWHVISKPMAIYSKITWSNHIIGIKLVKHVNPFLSVSFLSALAGVILPE